VPYNRAGDFLHVVPAGTSHHIAHLFGYWLMTDADCVWLQVERASEITCMLVIGGRSGAHREHRLAWCCPHCGAALAERGISLVEPTLAAFRAAELDAVRAFNATDRTCAGCGQIHPLAYGMEPAHDRAEERAARERW